MDVVYGLKPEEIAERTGVDVSTARRWKTGATRIPKSALLLLEADLGCFGEDWRGWRIVRGELVSPEGWRIKPGEVMAVPLLRQQLAAYQSAERVINALEEQPAPAEWTAQIA